MPKSSPAFLSVPFDRLGGMPWLWRHYAQAGERMPIARDADDLAARAAARGEPADRAGVAAAIENYLAPFRPPAPVQTSLQRLRQSGTVAVVTGQQPVLMGGPGYVLFKALTAIRVARELTDRGAPAVAIFWNASEDHDLVEANSVLLPRPDGGWRRRALDSLPALTRKPLSHLPLDDDAAAQIDTWRTEAEWQLAVPAQPNDTLASWQTRQMLTALGHLGLLVVEPHILRPFAGPLFERMLREFPALAADLDAAIDALTDVVPSAAEHRLLHPPLFEMIDGERQRIEVADAEAAAVRAAANPAAFSTTALSRPLLQNRVLPAVAYVAGPAELAYNALLRPWHERLGVPMAALIRRASATVATPFQPAGIVAAIEARGAAGEAVASLRAADAQLRQHVADAVAQVQEAAPAPTAAIAQSLDRLLHAVDRRIGRAQQARQQQPMVQLTNATPELLAAAQIVEPLPNRLQERVVPWVHLLESAGPRLIATLLDDAPAMPDAHLVI